MPPGTASPIPTRSATAPPPLLSSGQGRMLMQLSLFLWCRHHCARDQSHRATTSKAIVCAIALGSPTLALAQSAASLPKVGLLAWDYCDAPVLIAVSRSWAVFQVRPLQSSAAPLVGEMKAF